MTPPMNPISEQLSRFKDEVHNLSELVKSSDLTPSLRKTVEYEVKLIVDKLSEIHEEVDLVHQPVAVFNPGNPKTIGRFISVAMVAQKLFPLNEIPNFYGSGVYAIYYSGSYNLYSPLTGSETPIYVGKAEPKSKTADTPSEQACGLSSRLQTHRKNISACPSLDINDFSCRWLVITSGWESAAESYLINLFKPIWNKETKLIYGFGKHGDSEKTRKNKRSPWDTLHPGRRWAGNDALEDAKSIEEIQEALARHFAEVQIFDNREEILKRFFEELSQSK